MQVTTRRRACALIGLPRQTTQPPNPKHLPAAPTRDGAVSCSLSGVAPAGGATDPAGGEGYRLTDHVKRYYQTTKT